MTSLQQIPTERPIVVRGAILLFGLIILSTTLQRWFTAPVDPEKPIPIWLHVIPIVLGSSMVVQFFAKQRRSKLLIASLGLVLLSLLLLWMFASGVLK